MTKLEKEMSLIHMIAERSEFDVVIDSIVDMGTHYRIDFYFCEKNIYW